MLFRSNGHMPAVFDLTKRSKEKYGDSLVLMVGNVANPETYALLSDAGADYVRIGIGNGGGCLTTQNTGVGYPMASLIKECYEISTTLKKPAYIVADGGMQTYSDVIKALALGADFVMLGSILNKSCPFLRVPNYGHFLKHVLRANALRVQRRQRRPHEQWNHTPSVPIACVPRCHYGLLAH